MQSRRCACNRRQQTGLWNGNVHGVNHEALVTGDNDVERFICRYIFKVVGFYRLGAKTPYSRVFSAKYILYGKIVIRYEHLPGGADNYVCI